MVRSGNEVDIARMSKKRRTSAKSAKRHLSGSADAVRSMIRLALSLRGPEGETEGRIRSAIDAFSAVTPFDAWLVGSLVPDPELVPPAPVMLTNMLCGGNDAERVDATERRWANYFKQRPPAIQPVLSVLDSTGAQRELIRVWHDSFERALLSIRISVHLNENIAASATWISVHRIGNDVPRFTIRERRWLALLHEQFAALLNATDGSEAIGE